MVIIGARCRTKVITIPILLGCAVLVTSCANLPKKQLQTTMTVEEKIQAKNDNTSAKSNLANIDLSESELDPTDKDIAPKKKSRGLAWFFQKKDKTKTGSISKSSASDSTITSSASGLTLSDVIDSALQTNPDVVVATAQTAEASLGIKIAKAAYHPSVDLSVLSGVETTISETSNSNNIQREEANIQVRQTLFDFGQNKLAIERRKALYTSAQNRELDTKEQLTLEITEAYLNFLRQSELVTLAATNITVHKDIAKLVRLSEEGGNSTVADVKRVETRLDGANSAKLTGEDSLKDAIAAFKRLTGFEPNKVKRPKNIIPKSSNFLSGVSSKMLESNPKLKSLHLDTLSLGKQLSQQYKKLYPKVYALGEANYKRNNGGTTGVNKDYRAMLGMSWKLYDGGQREYVAEQIQMRVLEADAKYRKLHRELTENMDNTQQELKSGREKQAFLQSSVSSARKVMSLYREQYKAGERSGFEILDAQRDLYRAEQDLKNHIYNSAAAYYRELRIRGQLVEAHRRLK